jgi:alpha-tubulin suppressor-like RCC1 family protein
LYTWGRGREGQLGHSNRENLSEPQRVESLRNHKVVQAVAGHSHTVVLADTGEVWTFGKLHRLTQERHGSEAQGAWELTGLQKKDWVQKMIDKSMNKYLSGTLTKEEAGQHQFGLFEGYIQTVPKPVPFGERYAPT